MKRKTMTKIIAIALAGALMTGGAAATPVFAAEAAPADVIAEVQNEVKEEITEEAPAEAIEETEQEAAMAAEETETEAPAEETAAEETEEEITEEAPAEETETEQEAAPVVEETEIEAPAEETAEAAETEAAVEETVKETKVAAKVTVKEVKKTAEETKEEAEEKKAEETVTPPCVPGLEGRVFYLSAISPNTGKSYYFKNTTVKDGSLAMIARTAANDITGAAEYRFTLTTDNTGRYNISSSAGYIKMTGGNNLGFTGNVNDATAFQLIPNGNAYLVKGSNGSNENMHLNLKAKDAGKGFQASTYTDSSIVLTDASTVSFVKEYTVQYIVEAPSVSGTTEVTPLPQVNGEAVETLTETDYTVKDLTSHLYQRIKNGGAAAHFPYFTFEFEGWKTENGTIVKPNESIDLAADNDGKIVLKAVWSGKWAQGSGYAAANFTIWRNVSSADAAIDGNTLLNEKQANYTPSVGGAVMRAQGTSCTALAAPASNKVNTGVYYERHPQAQEGKYMMITYVDSTISDADAAVRTLAATGYQTSDSNSGTVTWQLSNLPSDAEVLASLKEMTEAGMTTLYDENNKPIAAEDLTTDNFEVLWCHVKYQSNGTDGWNINGKLARKAVEEETIAEEAEEEKTEETIAEETQETVENTDAAEETDEETAEEVEETEEAETEEETEDEAETEDLPMLFSADWYTFAEDEEDGEETVTETEETVTEEEAEAETEETEEDLPILLDDDQYTFAEDEEDEKETVTETEETVTEDNDNEEKETKKAEKAEIKKETLKEDDVQITPVQDTYIAEETETVQDDLAETEEAEETELADTFTENVATGDRTNVLTFIIAGIAAAAGVVGTGAALLKRRNRKDDDQ